MGRQVVTLAPFSSGLNTEINNLVDNGDYTTEELNCACRKDGSRTRRLGIDYEELYSLSNYTVETGGLDLAYAATEWNDIDGDKNNNYIVIQVGGTILFYKNNGAPFSAEEADFTLDLSNYKLEDTDDYKTTPVSFNVAYGSLFVSSTAIQPFRLETLTEGEEVVPEEVLPSAKISCRVPLSKKGRGAGDGYVQFYINGVKLGDPWTIRGTYGTAGNCSDGPWMPLSDVYAEYFNSLPEDGRRGITATATSSGEVSRWTDQEDFLIFNVPEDSGQVLKGTKITIEMGFLHQVRSNSDFVVLYYEGVLQGGVEYEHQQGLTLQVRDRKGVEDYLAPETAPEKLSYSKLYNLLNQGWTPKLIGDFYKAQVGGYKCFPSNNLAQQYLKDSETTAFKPTALLDSTFGNTPAPKGHYILDYFDQKRVDVSSLSYAMEDVASACGVTVNDIIDTNYPGTAIEQVPDYSPRYKYVSDTCAYAGRMFYLAGDVLLYSQVLAEDQSLADKCYQEADPTSEEISDIIDTDGGTLNMPDIGNGQKLVTVGSYLIAVGDRGLMAIGGTSNNIFTATAYSASNLPTYTTIAPQSFVSTEYGVLYWGDTGIIHISSTDTGISLKNISEGTVQKFYDKITEEQRKKCIGCYDRINKEIWWMYPDKDLSNGLSEALVFNLETQAFTPFSFATVSDDENFVSPKIVVPVALKVAFNSIKRYPIYTKKTTEEASSISCLEWYCNVLREQYFTEKTYYTPDGPLNPEGTETVTVYKDEDLTEAVEVNAEMFFSTYRILTVHKNAEELRATTVYSTIVTDDSGQHRVYSPSENLYNYSGFTDFGDTEVYTDIDLQIPYEKPLQGARVTLSLMLDVDLSTKPLGSLEDSIPQITYTAGEVVYTADTAGLRIVNNEGYTVNADEPVDDLGSEYRSIIFYCLDSNASKLTFADLTNLNCKDWDKADYSGDGMQYKTFIVGHPLNMSDIFRKKTIPYLLTTFRRTETGYTVDDKTLFPSSCKASVKWSWATSQNSGDWDMAQQVYRPDVEFLDREFVDTKTRVRGGGKAFSIKLESVSNYNFIIEALGVDIFGDSRI